MNSFPRETSQALDDFEKQVAIDRQFIRRGRPKLERELPSHSTCKGKCGLTMVVALFYLEPSTGMPRKRCRKCQIAMDGERRRQRKARLRAARVPDDRQVANRFLFLPRVTA